MLDDDALRGGVRRKGRRCARASSTGIATARLVYDVYRQAIHDRQTGGVADDADAHRHRRARAVRPRRPASAGISRGLLREWSADGRGRARTSSCSTRPSRSASPLDARRFRDAARRRRRRARGGSRCGCRASPPRDHLDVFFAPAYTAPLRLDVPIVVAIHDLSFVAHPEWFRLREGVRRRWLTQQSAGEARATDHHDLGVLAARARRTPLGRRTTGSTSFRRASIGPTATASRRGRDAPRAVRRLDLQSPPRAGSDSRRGAARARRGPDASLDIVGDNRTFPHEDLDGADREPRRSSGRVRWHRYVTDDQLRELYAQRPRVRVSVRVRRARADAARGARGRRAAGPARHAGRARELRGRGALRAGRRYRRPSRARSNAALFDEQTRARDARRRARRRWRGTAGRARRARRWRCIESAATVEALVDRCRSVDHHRQLQRARRSRALPRVAARAAARRSPTRSSSSTTSRPTAAPRRRDDGPASRVIEAGANLGLRAREQHRHPRQHAARLCCC